MDYQVAIPSYRRPTVVAAKTLKMLEAGGVPHDRITVFVASGHEADQYRPHLPPTVRIVVGVVGLVAQRAFIHAYYTRGQRILFVDDDIAAVKTLDASGNRLVTARLPDLAEQGFQAMEKHGARIWGVYPAASSLYMRKKATVSTELAYIAGGVYGILNDDPPTLLFGDNQEDKERTLRYFTRDGLVVRLNKWTIYTNYYSPGGMDSPTRKAETEAATQRLVDEFPGLVRRRHKGAKGIWDVTFHPPPVSVAEVMDDTITTLSVRADYADAKAALLAELRKPTFKPRKLQKAPPADRAHHGTRADVIGDVGHSITLGYGNTRQYGIAEFSWNRMYPDLLRALINFGNKIVPPGWEYTAITLNKGVLAKKHRDGNNVGRSVIVGIGDYTGGALRVWNMVGTESEDYDLLDRPTMFNGALRAHETQPFEGERWTIIYYKQKHQGVCAGMPPMRGDSEFFGVEELAVEVGGDCITHE
jgi:hypothetical protein